jgi:hypothetical protein
MRLSNNEMNLTKPAQAMKLRRLSQCWADILVSDGTAARRRGWSCWWQERK